MVAVEQPRADCGHLAALTQQCGKCLRWCCPECYAPWAALACGACRAEARATAAAPYAANAYVGISASMMADAVAAEHGDARCRDRSRTRGVATSHRHRDRADVRSLAARVADLERRLQELRPGPPG